MGFTATAQRHAGVLPLCCSADCCLQPAPAVWRNVKIFTVKLSHQNWLGIKPELCTAVTFTPPLFFFFFFLDVNYTIDPGSRKSKKNQTRPHDHFLKSPEDPFIKTFFYSHLESFTFFSTKIYKLIPRKYICMHIICTLKGTSLLCICVSLCWLLKPAFRHL